MEKLVFDNELTLDELLDTQEFKDLTMDINYEDIEQYESERIEFEYNQMVNDITRRLK